VVEFIGQALLLCRVSDNVDNVPDFVLLKLKTLVANRFGGLGFYVGGESDHALFAKATGKELACSRPGKLECEFIG
jgi:hypothetical protein